MDDESKTAAPPPLSARKKGLEYERAFADYMREHLGFPVVHEHALKSGADVLRPYECDLLGIVHSAFYRTLARAGHVLVGVSCIFLALLDIATADTATTTGYIIVLSLAVSVVAHTLGRRRSAFVVMVECRNRKEKVRKNYVAEVATRKRQILAVKAANWPNETWIVSSSGFDHDAVGLASAEGIHCIHFQALPPVASVVNSELKTRMRKRRTGARARHRGSSDSASAD